MVDGEGRRDWQRDQPLRGAEGNEEEG